MYLGTVLAYKNNDYQNRSQHLIIFILKRLRDYQKQAVNLHLLRAKGFSSSPLL